MAKLYYTQPGQQSRKKRFVSNRRLKDGLWASIFVNAMLLTALLWRLLNG